MPLSKHSLKMLNFCVSQALAKIFNTRCIAIEVVRLKLDWRTLDNINGITLTVRLSLEFRGSTAQIFYDKWVCTNAERHKYSHSHVSGTQASGRSDLCKTEPMARYHVYTMMCIKHIKICGQFRSGVCRLGSHVFLLFRQQHTFIRVYKHEYLACEWWITIVLFFAPIVAWAIVTCCTMLFVAYNSWVVLSRLLISQNR